MRTKICTKCHNKKELSFFAKRDVGVYGRTAECYSCLYKRRVSYQRTKNGKISVIYQAQKQGSKKRKQHQPNYTLKQFKVWILSHPIYHELYDNWKMSGYNKLLSPSCDRKDNLKSYSFDNIQIVTMIENKRNYDLDVKNGLGINMSKPYKPVIQLSLDNIELNRFISTRDAERKTGIYHKRISVVCNGIQKTSAGYKWKFA